mgnify:CR=1 FL=1
MVKIICHQSSTIMLKCVICANGVKQAETIANQIRKEGFAVIPAILNSNEVESYLSLTQGLSAKRLNMEHKNVRAFHGSPDNVAVIHNLQNKHYSFWKLIAHPLVVGVADILLKEGSFEDSEPYQLASCQARSITGHEDRQQLHIDSRLPGGNHALALVAGWSLTEFTAENGATRFVPKSHLINEFPAMGLIRDDEIIGECPPGSLILFNACLWHGASEKIDPSVRAGLFFNYCRWFMRPAFKINRRIPLEIREKLSDKMVELSGAYFEEPFDETDREVRKSNVPQW